MATLVFSDLMSIVKEQYGLVLLEGPVVSAWHGSQKLAEYLDDSYFSVSLALRKDIRNNFVSKFPEYSHFPIGICSPPPPPVCQRLIDKVDFDQLVAFVDQDDRSEFDSLLPYLDELIGAPTSMPATVKYAYVQSMLVDLRLLDFHLVTLDGYSEDPMPIIDVNEVLAGKLGSFHLKHAAHVPDGDRCRYVYKDGVFNCHARKTIFSYFGLDFVQIHGGAHLRGLKPCREPLTSAACSRKSGRWWQLEVEGSPVYVQNQPMTTPQIRDPVNYVLEEWKTDVNMLVGDSRRLYDFRTDESRLLWESLSIGRRAMTHSVISAAVGTGSGRSISEVLRAAARELLFRDDETAQYVIASRLLAMKGQFMLAGDRLLVRQ